MNTKTTKRAVAEGTTKAVPATGGKRSRRTATVGGGANEAATPAEAAGRKRRKPFVL